MRLIFTFVLLSLAATGAAAAVSPDEANRIMPPPGLYRIDRDSTVSHAQGGVASREQRSASSSTLTNTAPGVKAVRRIDGQHEETACLPPRRDHALALPPSMSAAACTNVSSDANGDRLVLVAQCRTGRLSTTIERLDQEHWNFITETEMGTAAGGADMNALRPMLERMAQHGATEAERAKARQMLASLPQMQAQQEQRLAAAGVSAASTVAAAQAMPLQVRSTARWTRIADHCGAQP